MVQKPPFPSSSAASTTSEDRLLSALPVKFLLHGVPSTLACILSLSGDLVVPTTPARGSHPCSNLTGLPRGSLSSQPTTPLPITCPQVRSEQLTPPLRAGPVAVLGERASPSAAHRGPARAPSADAGLSQSALPDVLLAAQASRPCRHRAGPPVHAACTHPVHVAACVSGRSHQPPFSPQGAHHCWAECELTALLHWALNHLTEKPPHRFLAAVRAPSGTLRPVRGDRPPRTRAGVAATRAP